MPCVCVCDYAETLKSPVCCVVGEFSDASVKEGARWTTAGA